MTASREVDGMRASHGGKDPPALAHVDPQAVAGLGVLRTIIDKISSGSDMDSVLADVIALSSSLTACRGALIYLWDERHEELVVRAATPEFQFAVGVVRLRMGQGLTGWAAMTRQPGVIADHPSLDSRFLSLPELDDDAFQSCLTVPLVARGERLIGVITLHSDAAAAFSDATVELMQTISSLVSDAVHLVQLDLQVMERDASLEMLSEAAGVHEASVSNDQRLYLLARSARDVMHTDLGAIILFDTERTALRIVTWCSDEPITMQHHPIALGAEWSRFLHGPAAAYRVTHGNPLRALVAGGSPFSTCFIGPIVLAGEPIGMVCCLDKAGRGLSEAESRDLTTLARIAAPIVGDLQFQRGQRSVRSTRALIDLLRAGDTEGALVRQLVRDLGVHTSDPCVVVECAGGATSEPTTLFEELEEAIHEVFPASLIDVSPNLLTALIPLRGASREAALARVVERVVKPGVAPRVGVGCSPAARLLSEYPGRMHQAAVAATVSRAASPHGQMVKYVDLGAERYLWSVAAETSHPDSSEPVEQLAAYDTDRGTDLLRTLEIYLSMGANINRAASELFVHRNTMRQRLERIAKITHLQLDDPTLWFELMLSIRLHRLRGGIH